MTIVIRTATPEDLRDTVLIYLECLREDYACKPQTYLDAMAVEYELAKRQEWLYESDQPNRIFVAIDRRVGQGEVMVGYIAVGPNVGRPYNCGGEVGGFFVRKPYCQSEIGLWLLKTGISYLNELGYRQVVIFNYRACVANEIHRRLGGEMVYREIRTPGGMPFETDVFYYEIPELLDTLDQRLRFDSIPS